MSDRLNFFEPWENLSASHENQLTRALLVVLRCSPIAHQAWLSLIDSKLSLYSLPRPTFDTQTSAALIIEVDFASQESIRGISVLCEPGKEIDDPITASIGVVNSDRNQVLDGVIQYDNDLVIVLESKLAVDRSLFQATNINLNNQPIHFLDRPKIICWSDIIAMVSDIVDDSRGIITGAERIILNDFLEFVNNYFSYLGPFSTIRRCAGEPSRIARRLDKILVELLGNNAPYLPGIHHTVALARLIYDKEKKNIELQMWPADTLEQARAFYSRQTAIGPLLQLNGGGWDIGPNFHFGFMQTGFCHLTSPLPLSLPSYLQYWVNNITNTGQVPREKSDEYWNNLVSDGIINADDRHKFDSDFTNTKKTSATPRPGIGCLYIWSLNEAEHLDTSGKFSLAVRHRINELLEALGENQLPPEARLSSASATAF